MWTYLDREVAEIARDRALRLYGAALALTNLLTYWFWSHGGVVLRYLSDRATNVPLCWPFFPACHLVQIPYAALVVITVLYAGGALLSAGLFLIGRVRAAWWGLALLTLTKWALLALDYRAMGNYHYMPLLTSLVFLFVPGKRRACGLLLLAFYVTAGTLKLNAEWFSGQAIYGRPFAAGVVLEWLCIGAVVIELVVVWGLLARERLLRYGALFSLIAFHAFSYHIVGYFYPGIMFLLLTIFPLKWILRAPKVADLNRFRVPAAHAGVLLAFAIAQLIPRLQDGDPALISRGRLYALDMFDAYARCQSTIVVKYERASYQIPTDTRALGVRIACDPIVYWNLARHLCRENRGREHFRDVDVLLTSKRTNAETSTPVMAVRNFCRLNPGYNTLWPNAWMSM